MTTKEILIEARKLVEKGWYQGRDIVGCVCATDAIMTACRSGGGSPTEAFYHLRRANNIPIYIGIIGWNDAPGRTQAEVLAAFDKAIAEAE